MERMIEFDHVSKSYRDILFEDACLTVNKGDVCAILGPNGIGKSVLLKMVCGLVLPDSGTIIIDGVKLKKGVFPQNVGVILDSAGFLPGETGYQNLKTIAEIRSKITKTEIYEVMRLVGLDPHSKVKVGKYSLGMKQRLAFAQAIMEKPGLLILDEPFNSLDRAAVDEFKNILIKLNQGEKVTIVMTSHHMSDLEGLCNVVYEIEHQKLVKME